MNLTTQTATTQPVDAAVKYGVNLTGLFKSVVTGSGNDTVVGNATIGTAINGGNGNNTLTGGSGNDTLTGGMGNDHLIGGGGIDSLSGGTGNNTLNGSAGIATYIFAPRTGATANQSDSVLGSNGSNTLSFAAFTDSIMVNLQTTGIQTVDSVTTYMVNLQGTFLTLNGGAGNNVLTGNATLGTRIVGGAGNNILIGGTGNDVLIGGAGNDILIGGLGTDTLTGNAGDDILIGGTFSFSNNIAALVAIQSEWTSANPYQSRVDHLDGVTGGGLNTIAGGASGDFFLNLSTPTTITPGTKKDTLTGGAGNDWFWAAAIDTTDRSVGVEVLN